MLPLFVQYCLWGLGGALIIVTAAVTRATDRQMQQTALEQKLK